MRVQIFKFPWVEARSLRNSQVFSSTSDVNSIQKIIVSSPTLFPVLLILPRWQQVTCSLIVSFLGIVGPKCCDSMKCHCFWEVMVFLYRPRGESRTSYVFLVVILNFNVKLYFKLRWQSPRYHRGYRFLPSSYHYIAISAYGKEKLSVRRSTVLFPFSITSRRNRTIRQIQNCIADSVNKLWI